QVRYAVDEEDLICWFISGLKELCRSKVMALSLTSFEAAKVVAEMMDKHWLELTYLMHILMNIRHSII
ncbi:26323_t:CDS:2, partial [Dentiscutata erythropus]